MTKQIHYKNEVQLRGVLAVEPNEQKTQAGTSVAHLVITTTGRSRRTQRHRVTVWGGLKEKVHEGDVLEVHGWLSYGTYERAGVTIPSTDIIATVLRRVEAVKRGRDVADGTRLPV